MKRGFILSLLFVVIYFLRPPMKANPQISQGIDSAKSSKSVYICTGASSKKYHFTKSCRGLSNCKSEIRKTTEDEAIKKGRTLCGWED